MRVLLAACGIATGLFASPVGAWADKAPPLTWQGIEITPYAGASLGFSTNPDEMVDGEDSIFTRYDAGLTAAMKAGKSQFKAEVRGRIVDYADLEKRFRWLYEASAGGETRLSEKNRLEFDVRRKHDALDDTDEEISHRARAAWTHYAEHAEVKFAGSFRNKDFLAPEEDNVFDYLMPGAEFTARVMPEAKVSPFLIVRGADVNYINQAWSEVDRDARDYSAIGGLRLRPAKTIELDIGGRYNWRLIEDDEFSRIDNSFVDARLHWTPSEAFELEAAVWRELAEPSKKSGAVADQINYELGFVLTPADRWHFEAKGLFERENEAGANEIATNFEITAAGFYELDANARIFLKVRQLWEADRDTDDDSVERSTTTEIQIGIETAF